MRTGWADPSLAVENALAAEAAGVPPSLCMAVPVSKCIQVTQTLRPLHDVAQALTKIPLHRQR